VVPVVLRPASAASSSLASFYATSSSAPNKSVASLINQTQLYAVSHLHASSEVRLEVEFKKGFFVLRPRLGSSARSSCMRSSPCAGVSVPSVEEAFHRLVRGGERIQGELEKTFILHRPAGHRTRGQRRWVHGPEESKVGVGD